MWHYNLPKENGVYLVSCIAEYQEIQNGYRTEKFTEYAWYDAEEKSFSDGEGYEYHVYAWDYPIAPAEQLNDVKWKWFCIRKEATWREIYEFIKKKKLTFEFDGSKADWCYTYVNVLCDTEEENIIKNYIDKEYI